MSVETSPSRLSVSSPLDVTLRSVNVALPTVIGTHRGKPVLSGIKKRPVETPTLHLDTLNLAGDRQADLRVHGGPEKAVYAYPSEYLPLWTAELDHDPPFAPGSFGENLTVAGWFEDQVRIGDVWSWGDALLQVCQPRFPCYKLALATDRPQIAKPFVAKGRTGWYFRVLRPGQVPTSGPITILERDPAATVLDAHRALVLAPTRENIDRVLSAPALAANWRAELTVLRDRLTGNI
jgi:MOSC domain-containing protein YiiM